LIALKIVALPLGTAFVYFYSGRQFACFELDYIFCFFYRAFSRAVGQTEVEREINTPG
jgi:hypothetical protein